MSRDQPHPAPTQISGVTSDSYLERIRTYVPIEVIAFFIFVNGMASRNDLMTPAGTYRGDGWVALLAFVIGFAVSVALTYRRLLGRANPTPRLGASLAGLAFLIWSYAIEGHYITMLGLDYRPSVAALALGVFSLASAFLGPAEQGR